MSGLRAKIPVSMFDREMKCFLITGHELAELRYWAYLSCFLVGIPFLIFSVFRIVGTIRIQSTPTESET